MSPSLPRESRPLISVIMPVYNAERYVAEAVNSILAQTYPRLEFIIADDGSADGSPAIIREFAARNLCLRAIFLAHGGEPQALNAGIAAASGEYLAFMDHDDIALPHRLATQLDWMVRKGVDVCGTQAQIFGDTKKLLWFPETHEAIRRELVFRLALIKNSVMMRAAIARRHRWEESTPAYEYRMWLELSGRYRLGNVPMVLMRYRRHPEQFTQRCSSQLGMGMREWRRSYFNALYPDSQPRDYDVISRVAEHERMENANDLRLVGKWLARLAQAEDNFLRDRMARRWLETCRNSAHLGMDCRHIYREIAPQFGLPVAESAWGLSLQCALHMRTGSRSHAILRRIKHALFAGGADRAVQRLRGQRRGAGG